MITCRSPAKLNLFLRITGKREDGSHNLVSVFQLLDWYDMLHFEPAASLQFSLKNKKMNVPDDDTNLVVLAARLLADYSRSRAGIAISLTKNIPTGSGLGSGSSNAAITLLALNKLWHLDLPLATLIQLGSELGADIPFFLGATTALVQGKGEHLTRVSVRPGWYILCLNDVFCSTENIFSSYRDSNWQLTREDEWVGLPALGHASSLSPADLMLIGNQLMSVVFKLYPKLEKDYQEFSSICRVTMSGSGSTLFALAESGEKAQQIVHQLEQCRTGCRFVVAKGISHCDWYDVGV